MSFWLNNNLFFRLCFVIFGAIVLIVSNVSKYSYAMNLNIHSSNVYVVLESGSIYYNSLKDAIKSAKDNTETFINLAGDIYISDVVSIPSNKKIIIEGNNHTLFLGQKKINSWYTGTFFDISQNCNLILKNVVLNGGNNWKLNSSFYQKALMSGERIRDESLVLQPEEEAPIVTSWLFDNRGTVSFENSAVKNFYFKEGGIFRGTPGSEIYFMGSKVLNCASLNGGLVAYLTGLKTKFYFESSSVISGNHTGNNGGLFHVNYNAILYINDGEISNNTALNSNGTVAMVNGTMASLVLNGGKIQNNSGLYGINYGINSVIYALSDSQIVMNDGVIEENYGRITGGIYATNDVKNIQLNGGIIRNNKSNLLFEKQSDLNIGSTATFVIKKDMVVDGNIFLSGNLTNFGNLNGNIYMDLTDSKDTKALNGNGQINSNVFIKQYKNKKVLIDKKSKIKGDIIIYTPIDALVTCELNCKDKNNKERIIIPTSLGSIPVLPDILREGYTFDGWYLDKEFNIPWEDTLVFEDMVLYAKWKVKSHLVSFDIDGVIFMQQKEYGSKINLPKTPAKDGYTFVKWKYYSKDMTMPDTDITFKAIWKKNES